MTILSSSNLQIDWKKESTNIISKSTMTVMARLRPSTVSTVLFVATLLVALVGTDGFVAPSSAKAAMMRARSPTELGMSDDIISTGWDSFKIKGRPIKDLESGEASRKYRRTVYTHKDWVKHRSTDRFIYYLLAIFKSGVYQNIGREVAATTSIAVFVFLYNLLVSGYVDLEGVQHAAVIGGNLPKLGLPLAPFTLASPSLGLLLGMLFVCQHSWKVRIAWLILA